MIITLTSSQELEKINKL